MNKSAAAAATDQEGSKNLSSAQPAQYVIISQEAFPVVKGLLHDAKKTYILSIPDNLLELASSEDMIQLDGVEKKPSLTTSTVDGGKSAGVNQTWFTSRDTKYNLLKYQGHSWRQGMWSKEETELLRQNILKYCTDHEIEDPASIIFSMAKEERKDFYRSVADGLERPLFAVYRRVLRLYDQKNHRGRYSPQDLDRLKQLLEVHGRNWQAIGAAMGRSAASIKDRCRLLKENCNQGKWSDKEEQLLATAVYQLAGATPGQMVSSGLAWSSVAALVGSRTEKQCRTKWLHYLNWKEAGGQTWTQYDDELLVIRVYGLSAQDENDIDWKELAKGWSSVRSPQWLRGKWWTLRRMAPSHLSFSEACHYLYQQQIAAAEAQEKKDSSNQSSATSHHTTFQSSEDRLESPSEFVHEICVPEEMVSLGAEVVAEDVPEEVILSDPMLGSSTFPTSQLSSTINIINH